LDTLEKLEAKIGQILGRVKELEKINRDLARRNEELETEMKKCRLELVRMKEEKSETEQKSRERDSLVQNRIVELLGKLEEVEAEIA